MGSGSYKEVEIAEMKEGEKGAGEVQGFVCHGKEFRFNPEDSKSHWGFSAGW